MRASVNAGQGHCGYAFLTDADQPRANGGICWLIAGLLVASGLVPAESASARAADWLQPSEIAAMWDGQRSDVVTANIRFLCFNGPVPDSTITSERLAELIDRHDFVDDAAQLRPFLLEVLGGSFRRDPPWAEMSLVQSGRRRRMDEERMTFVRDGAFDLIQLPQNRQISAYLPEQSSLWCYELNDLRWTPPAPMPAERLAVLGREGADWRVAFLPAKGAVENALPAEGLVDDASGILTRKWTRSADGMLLKERFQLGIHRYPGDVDFPRAHVEAQYSDGMLSDLRVMLVQDAEFNRSIAESRFVLGAAAGTILIDRRGGEKTAQVVSADVPDVRSLLTAESVLPHAAREPDAGGDSRRLLLVVNAVALAILGLLIVLRRTKRAGVPKALGNG